LDVLGDGGAEGVIIGGLGVDVVAGGIERGHDGEQSWACVQLARLGWFGLGIENGCAESACKKYAKHRF